MSGFPKPPYETPNARHRRIYRIERPKIREAKWHSEKGRCQFPTCRRWVSLAQAHVHEEPPRSVGGDPLNLCDTVLFCDVCHGQYMHGRIGGALKRVERDPETRKLRFFERSRGREDWREVQ